MARHLDVPEPALQRLLREQPKARQNFEPDPDEVLLPDLPSAGPQGGSSSSRPAAKPTMLQRTEALMLACVLAQPDLLVSLDFDETPLQVAEIKQLFDWAAEGLAIGRDAGPDLFRYLFTRASDLPALQSMLALAHERADGMVEPGEVLSGIITGRQRVVGGSQRRSLREKWLQAIKAGDTATATELQAQMLESKRRERPRAGTMELDAGSAVPLRRPPPKFGLAAQDQNAARAPDSAMSPDTDA